MSKREDQTSLIATEQPPAYDTIANATLNSQASDYGTKTKFTEHLPRNDLERSDGTNTGLLPGNSTIKASTAKDAEEEEEGSFFKDFSKLKIFTFIVMSLVNIICSIFFSMISPFYPVEAAKKGATPYQIGIVFGITELFVVIFSPIFGSYLNSIGAKFMFVTGLFFTGSCATIFGVMNLSPGGTVYVVMCALIRGLAGVGIAAINTADYTIVATTFRSHVATFIATMEMFQAVGFMIGPVIGGGLFEAGGYMTPFFFLGGLFILAMVTSVIFLPSQKPVESSKGSIFDLLRIPAVLLVSLPSVFATFGFGYVDVGFALHLRSLGFEFSSLKIGAIIIAPTVLFALGGPVFGWLGDTNKIGIYEWMTIGNLLASFCFMLVGPIPYMRPDSPQMLLIQTVLSYGAAGLSYAPTVLTYKAILDIAIDFGFEDNASTYSMVSGIVGSSMSLGAVLGPTLGGVLQETVGFSMGCVVLSGAYIVVGLLVGIVKICNLHKPNHTDSAEYIDTKE